jgi:hypothetical protein
LPGSKPRPGPGSGPEPGRPNLRPLVRCSPLSELFMHRRCENVAMGTQGGGCGTGRLDQSGWRSRSSTCKSCRVPGLAVQSLLQVAGCRCTGLLATSAAVGWQKKAFLQSGGGRIDHECGLAREMDSPSVFVSNFQFEPQKRRGGAARHAGGRLSRYRAALQKPRERRGYRLSSCQAPIRGGLL